MKWRCDRSAMARGYALTWGTVSHTDPPERVLKGAVQLPADVPLVLFHDRLRPLARTADGSLALRTDSHGLRFEFALPATVTGRDTLHGLRNGSLSGASFTFNVRRERWRDGVRELVAIELLEIALTHRPLYPGTSVELLEVADVS